MRWGGETVLAGLALLCVHLARRFGRVDRPLLPPGWSNLPRERRPAAALFLKRYCLGLAALLLIDAALIGRLPWKIPAAFLTVSGLAALAAAAIGVRRFLPFSD